MKLDLKSRPVAYVITSTNHGTMIVNRNDYMEINGQKHGVGFHLLNESCFDPDEVSIALQLLSERRKYYGDGVVAIDCGANIGVHTIEWSRHMSDWGQVLAIEAQERVYYALAGNIAINNCFNAKAIWMAVGKASGSVLVPQPNYMMPGSFGSLEIRATKNNEFIGQEISYSAEDMLETQMIALDDLALNRIDFIKIDVEGMEVETLQGSKKSLSKCTPAIVIERIKSNEKEIIDILSSIGYRLFPLGINFLAIHETDKTINLFK